MMYNIDSNNINVMTLYCINNGMHIMYNVNDMYYYMTLYNDCHVQCHGQRCNKLRALQDYSIQKR